MSKPDRRFGLLVSHASDNRYSAQKPANFPMTKTTP
jgi:hypothetical protein